MAKKTYIDFFPEIFRERIEAMQEGLEELKEQLSENDFSSLDSNINFLAMDFKSIAIGEYILNHDIVRSKQCFFLASRLREYLIRSYDNKSFPVSPSFVTMNNYVYILMALISDSQELVHSFSKLIGGRTKEEKDQGHPFSDNVGYSVKYLLLREDDKAIQHIEKLLKMRHQKNLKLYTGYITTLSGIYDSDVDVVQEGLSSMLKSHKKNRSEYHDTPEELFSIPVLGMAKLAIARGMDINIDDPITPKTMLETHEIDYPSLDIIED